MPLTQTTLVLGVLLTAAGCQIDARTFHPSPAPASLPISIPQDVQRIAVLYPKTASPDLVEAYHRLEGETFRLKRHRPALRIVDRGYLALLRREQQLQLSQGDADDGAVRVGRLLGVDSVLIYRIDGPSYRDRIWARQGRDVPPITVTSKLIRVESAEVLYHRVVVAHLDEAPGSGWWPADNLEYHRLAREAMERGILQTVEELGRALE